MSATSTWNGSVLMNNFRIIEGVPYEDATSELKICAVLDDSSRKILAIDEFATINSENTIAVIERAFQEYEPICPVRELIMNHGREFGAHRKDENGDWDGEFKQYL